MSECLILPVFILSTFVFNSSTPMLCESPHMNVEHYLLNNSSLVFDNVSNYNFSYQKVYFGKDNPVEVFGDKITNLTFSYSVFYGQLPYINREISTIDWINWR